MDFNISLGLAGWALLILGAIVVGIAIQLIGRADFGYEWVVTAIGGLLGAVVASELIIGMRGFEPVFDGLALVPALIGGVVVALVVAITTRLATGGGFTAGAAS